MNKFADITAAQLPSRRSLYDCKGCATAQLHHDDTLMQTTNNVADVILTVSLRIGFLPLQQHWTGGQFGLVGAIRQKSGPSHVEPPE
jgi:hypothetical protein